MIKKAMKNNRKKIKEKHLLSLLDINLKLKKKIMLKSLKKWNLLKIHFKSY